MDGCTRWWFRFILLFSYTCFGCSLVALVGDLSLTKFPVICVIGIAAWAYNVATITKLLEATHAP